MVDLMGDMTVDMMVGMMDVERVDWMVAMMVVLLEMK